MSTSIARIGILSPVTEAGLKRLVAEAQGGARGTRLRRRSQHRVHLALRRWEVRAASRSCDRASRTRGRCHYARNAASHLCGEIGIELHPHSLPARLGSGRDGHRLQPGAPWWECHRDGNHVAAAKPTETGARAGVRADGEAGRPDATLGEPRSQSPSRGLELGRPNRH